uniref:Uncharacterized protein n=1 Tax=Sarcophilus harrisii TaxID=9305 RepID=A0A7N4NWB0_SARHA
YNELHFGPGTRLSVV